MPSCRLKPTDNETRVSRTDCFKCPKGEVLPEARYYNEKEALEVDRKLSHLQYFLPDTISLLVAAMEELTSTETSNWEVVPSAISRTRSSLVMPRHIDPMSAR